LVTPSPDNLGFAHRTDAGHLSQARRLALDHLEHLVPERLYEFPGVSSSTLPVASMVMKSLDEPDW